MKTIMVITTGENLRQSAQFSADDTRIVLVPVQTLESIKGQHVDCVIIQKELTKDEMDYARLIAASLLGEKKPDKQRLFIL